MLIVLKYFNVSVALYNTDCACPSFTLGLMRDLNHHLFGLAEHSYGAIVPYFIGHGTNAGQESSPSKDISVKNGQ